MGGRPKRDLVSMIEAAYAMDLDQAEWVARLAHVGARALGFDCPVVAGIVDASEPTRLRFGELGTCNAPLALLESARRETMALEPATLVRLYSSHPPVTLLSEILQDTARARRVNAEMAAAGFRDCVRIRGLGLDRRGVLVSVMLPETQALPSRTRGALARVARHLAAAYRLRVHPGATDAIVASTGRVEHAAPELRQGDALGELTRAVRRVGMARGKLRREEPERAVELWRALVGGRWSVVERIESDGKRYLLARRNAPDAAHPKSLTPIEGQAFALASAGHSNRAIACELGLSAPRVSRLVSGAMTKLGIGSRAELASYASRPALNPRRRG